MAIPLTINGATFEYPQNFDENWGVEATGWAQAVTNGMLQMSGGSFPITADINFGPNFGLLSKYFETRSALPATTGTVRLSSADAGIAFRNNANSGNLILTTNSSDTLLFNGSPISGGVNPGVQYQLGYYATTGSALSGLTLITANRGLISDANGLPIASVTTATEIGFVNGVTSSIQTQLSARVTSVSGTANQITSTGGTTPVLAIANPVTFPGAMTAGGALAMASNKITGLAAGTTNGDAVRYEQIGFNPAGYIIGTTVQAIQFVDTAATSTSSATYQSTTTVASITPKSTTHKIRISVSGTLQDNNISTADVAASVFRGGTDLDTTGVGFVSMGSATTSTQLNVPASFVFLDAPVTTSALTYTVKIRVSAGAGTVIWNRNSGSAVIILEEIAY